MSFIRGSGEPSVEGSRPSQMGTLSQPPPRNAMAQLTSAVNCNPLLSPIEQQLRHFLGRVAHLIIKAGLDHKEGVSVPNL